MSRYNVGQQVPESMLRKCLRGMLGTRGGMVRPAARRFSVGVIIGSPEEIFLKFFGVFAQIMPQPREPRPLGGAENRSVLRRDFGDILQMLFKRLPFLGPATTTGMRVGAIRRVLLGGWIHGKQ